MVLWSNGRKCYRYIKFFDGYFIYKNKFMTFIKGESRNRGASFTNFLIKALWFWLLLLITLVASFSVISFKEPPLLYVRYFLGLMLIAYLPGAFLIELIYPKEKGISQMEKVILSIIMSISLTISIGLILNMMGIGIKIFFILLLIIIVSTLSGLLAIYRKYKLSACE